MIKPKDISIVFQGNVPQKSTPEYHVIFANIAQIRRVFLDSPVLLGTWDGCIVPQNMGIDRVVFSKDPGPLPSFKKNALQIENNVNRQIFCSTQVLKEVQTKYTLKLRLDCALHHTGFLNYYVKYGKTADNQERIAIPCFFTIDPRMYEQMPFHISDWFTFGPTEKLQQLWDVPFMSRDDSTYYDRNSSAPHSSFFDKLFRSRFAIEQHIAIHYAQSLGYTIPAFHNDISGEVLRSHDSFVAREFLILDLDQYGLVCQKYAKVSRSSFQQLNCLKFLDWYLLNVANDPEFKVDSAIYRAAVKRTQIKKYIRLASIATDPLMPFIKQPVVKHCVSRVLRAAMHLKSS
jgi:hypothetical protein